MNGKRAMDLNPPSGSTISVATDGADHTIIIPAESSPTRYFGGAFLLFWLGGWTFGFFSAVSKIQSGGTSAFLLFWLAGWTVAGIFAAYTVYRIFRPPVPETLQLGRTNLAWDSGIPPFQFNSSGNYASNRQRWKSTFPKRVTVEIDRRQLQSLRLRETEAGNRLTVDVDAQRIEIASGASEVEREWLARLLARRYGLPQVSASATTGEDSG
jgi:hypothetical protein